MSTFNLLRTVPLLHYPTLAAGFLAVGWHTLAWAMSNLFPPMLLISIPVAVWAVVKGKSTTKDKMIRQARRFSDQLLSSQKLSVETAYKHQTERSAWEFVDRTRRAAYEKAVGIDSRKKVYRVLGLIDEICADLNVPIAPSRVDFMRMGFEAVEQGNSFAAAALSVQAFEGCLEMWLKKTEIDPPRHTDFLRRSIDLLRGHPSVPNDVASQLDTLRRTRNRWAHGMRDLVELSETERRRRVKGTLENIRSLS